ncbi:MAG: PIN/TRAM domain-containing protein [Phycisphaeraceae bacterium]
MVLNILRGAFVVLVTAVAALYLIPGDEAVANQQATSWPLIITGIVATMALAAGVVAVDALTRRKRLAAVSGVFLGLIAGLVAAYALSFVVDLVGLLYFEESENVRKLLEGVKVIIGLVTSYIGITMVLQTKDDFRFVIPYVEFAKQIRGSRPIILDTSIIVDGRITDIVDTRVMQGTLVVPKFVLGELQAIADSSDKLRRARGRRGLDILQKLRESPVVHVHIEEADAEGASVDQKLISLAQQMQGRVMTNDYNLNKIAELRGVEVINLNDLAKAMRPVVLPGEHMAVRLIKPGESPSQGVGYLEDGTMVVVEEGRPHIGEEVTLEVTSTLQTSAGRMIFGRYEASRNGEGGSGDSRSGSEAVPAGDTGGGRSDSSATGSPVRRGRSGRPPSGRNPRRG